MGLSRGLSISGVLVVLAVPSGALGAATTQTMPSDGQIFRTIEELVSHGPRRAGTPAGEYAVGYVRDQFRKAGLSGVHVEQTPTNAWQARASSLSVGGAAVDAFAVAYSQSPSQNEVGEFSTPPGGLDAPLVDGGLGTPPELLGKDVKGKIVVFDLKFILPTAAVMLASESVYDPGQTLIRDPLNLIVANPYQSTYTTAIKAIQDAGAVGFIGVLADYFDSNKYYNEYYGSLNVRLPGMWVSKKEGARIRAALQAQPGTRANMVLQTHKAKTPSHVVVGVLEGRSKESILVASHHDSVWEGAVEDGSGAAEVIALAKYYGAMKPGERQRSLMFATFDSHFSGYQAHDAFAYRHVQHRDPARDPHEPVAVVAIEHIAKHGIQDAGGTPGVSELPEARGVFENLQPRLKGVLTDAIRKRDLRRTAVLNAEPLQVIGIPTDVNWALLGGLPTASFISGPNYLYDETDTLDKVAKNDLQKVAMTFADLIDALDTTPKGQLGLPPLTRAKAKGPASTDAPDDAVFGPFGARPSCKGAASGAVVRGLKLRRSGRRLVLTFRARRTTRAVISFRRGGRTVRTRRTLTACRDYRMVLARGARSVTVRAVR